MKICQINNNFFFTYPHYLNCDLIYIIYIDGIKTQIKLNNFNKNNIEYIINSDCIKTQIIR